MYIRFVHTATFLISSHVPAFSYKRDLKIEFWYTVLTLQKTGTSCRLIYLYWERAV